MSFLTTLFGFLVKEIKQTLRDPRMAVVLFVAPIFQLTLFGVALSTETRNVRLASVHAPGDTQARHLYERALASGWFVAAETEGLDPFAWVRSGEAEAVLVAPRDSLTREIGRGDASLQLLVNAQNAVRAQAIESYLRAIAAEELAPREHSAMTPLGIHFDVRALYNPMLDTSIYMVPGVMCLLVCLATILLTSMSLAREREIGTLETLISAPVHSWEIIAGKTFPFVLLGMIQMPLILSAGIVLFHVPFRGPLWMFFVSALLFVATSVSIGILISTIAKSQQQAMLGGFIFLFPAVLLSGLMFPLENMPWLMRMIAQLNPLTHFIALLRNILLKGGNATFFATHSAALLALAVIFVATSLSQFRTRL